ncbi:flagellar basal body rod protein FlgB [Oleispirillum naphthae]|uniref:flagellar basal body rod protein FlgB n=1 Tax=Oleispirillum naphthae TaxID=2838853 RepID=UPI0030824C09
MDLQNLTFFQMAQERMDWLAQRQKVVSQNLANANTPGYAAKDLKEIDFKDALSRTLAKDSQSVAVARTDPKHLSGSLPKSGPYRVETVRRPYEYTLDKNGVDVEEQMAKAANNRTQYEVAANLFSKNINMIKTALGRGGS